MANDWEEKSVAELQSAGALLVEDGNHGENRPRPDEFSSEGIQFIRAADIDSGRVLFESAQRINEVARRRIRKGIGAGGDVLLSHKGTVGKVAYVPMDAPPFVCSPQTTFWRVKDPKQLDRRYIYFYLLSRAFREQLDSRKGETDMADYVSLTTQRTLKVAVPPLSVQKATAAVLGALDDKIHINRRKNATLEAIARALYRSWFVDFDPVRAKLDGRPPIALDPATATLFPDSFQESSFGRIPHGWTAGNFANVISSARERIGDSKAVVLSAVSSSQLVRSDEHFNKQVYSKSINNYLKVHLWDFAYNPSRINIGSIGMLKENIVGAVSPVYEVFRPKVTYHWLIERALAQPETTMWIQTLCSGSVRQSLKLKDLASIPLVIPPPRVVQAFNKSWEQWNELIQANERESRTLATLRDTLLPKMLSGEIRLDLMSEDS